MKRTRCPFCDFKVTCKNKGNIQKALDSHLEVCEQKLKMEELRK